MLSPEQKEKTIDLIHLMSGIEKIDAMSLAMRYQKETGKHIDWHEFSSFLDSLHTRGFLKITKPGGWVEYDLEKGGSFQNEARGLKPGDVVKILCVYRSQGCINPVDVLGKTITIQGVNYDQHWAFGTTENGREIGLPTFHVARV